MPQHAGPPTELDLRHLVSPADLDAFTRFMALSCWDVEAIALRQQKRDRTGTTWIGLSNLMQRKGYASVEVLGIPAAAAWARRLDVIGERRSVSAFVEMR
jgi:hypothetical protein